MRKVDAETIKDEVSDGRERSEDLSELSVHPLDDDTRVAAGAVVIEDVPDNMTVAGVPARAA